MSTVQTSDAYIKICLRTWLFCESCIQSETATTTPNSRIIRSCHRCAHACLAVVTGLINKKELITDDIFRCMLYCRACEIACSATPHTEETLHCAEACRDCAENLSQIAWYFSMN